MNTDETRIRPRTELCILFCLDPCFIRVHPWLVFLPGIAHVPHTSLRGGLAGVRGRAPRSVCHDRTRVAWAAASRTRSPLPDALPARSRTCRSLHRVPAHDRQD